MDLQSLSLLEYKFYSTFIHTYILSQISKSLHQWMMQDILLIKHLFSHANYPKTSKDISVKIFNYFCHFLQKVYFFFFYTLSLSIYTHTHTQHDSWSNRFLVFIITLFFRFYTCSARIAPSTFYATLFLQYILLCNVPNSSVKNVQV